MKTPPVKTSGVFVWMICWMSKRYVLLVAVQTGGKVVQKNINPEDVINAVKRALKEPWPTNRDARTYRLIYEGNEFPVKYIYELAKEISGVEKPQASDFNSVEAVFQLSSLGFTIEHNFKDEEEFLRNEISKDDDISNDVMEIANDPNLNETQIKRQIDARLGQGKFRRDVLASCNNRCVITGCMANAVLRASHIKPWRTSDNVERLDAENGLILVANFDALFDQGLISFEVDGQIIVSSALSNAERKFFNVEKQYLRRKISGQMALYIKYHRENIFQK